MYYSVFSAKVTRALGLHPPEDVASASRTSARRAAVTGERRISIARQGLITRPRISPAVERFDNNIIGMLLKSNWWGGKFKSTEFWYFQFYRSTFLHQNRCIYNVNVKCNSVNSMYVNVFCYGGAVYEH